MQNKVEKQVEAISFEEFMEKKKESIPSFVIEAVNELLFSEWNGEQATIDQEMLIDKIGIPSQYEGMSGAVFRSKLFKNNWLDFEDLYREKGWDVEYVKPSLHDNFKAFFRFKKGK